MSFAKRPFPAPIHDLQMMLRVLQPEQGLGLDGISGQETQEAVRAFQKKRGLPQTGEADLETWEAMVRDYDREITLKGQAEPLLIVLQPYQVLERGSKNVHLYVVQAMLLALAQFYYELPQLTVNGVLDAPTSQALLWLQRSAELPETGELDKVTWQHLTRQYRQAVGDGTVTYPIRRR